MEHTHTPIHLLHMYTWQQTGSIVKQKAQGETSSRRGCFLTVLAKKDPLSSEPNAQGDQPKSPRAFIACEDRGRSAEALGQELAGSVRAVSGQACMAEAERLRHGGPGDKPRTFGSRRTKWTVLSYGKQLV